MHSKELESFFLKFNQLWRAGESAKLDLETHAGQAWVGVRVHLGPAHPYQVHVPSHQEKRTRNSPARERRRAKRLAARQQNGEVIENVNVDEAEEAENIESEHVVSDTAVPLDEAEKAKENESDKVAEDAAVPVDGGENKKQNESESVAENAAVPANSEENTEEVIEEICDAKVTQEEAIDHQKIEALEVVHATAHFENSPFKGITQDDISSLERYICSEDHLTRNIARIEIDLKLNLEAEVRLHVRRNNLQESPRNYILKFLGGENFWDRQNGTKIRLKRIHAK